MKKTGLFSMMLAFVLTACNSNQVTVRGELTGFAGTARMSAEMPGQGVVILAEQQVSDGNIELSTDALELPARVWLYFNNGTDEYTREFILDSKDKCSIRGKGKFLDQMSISGSALNKEYLELRKQLGEKYDGPIEKAERSIAKLRAKEKPTQTDRVLLEYNISTLQRHISTRFRYARRLVEANPEMEISLFLLKDMLKDSVDIQREVFNKLKIENKESNIYQVLNAELNS